MAVALGARGDNRQGNIMANYGNYRERIKFDFGLNLGFMIFYNLLSACNLVYWGGFVTGISFTVHL